jgi:predicted nuclease of predicted toxin-antitoxin system
VKFLIDAQLPPALADVIAGLGHTAVHVEQIGMRHASDSEIVQAALQKDYILVTKDRDFASETARGLSIIWVRTGNLPNAILFERARSAWAQVEHLLDGGASLVELR